MKTTHLVSETIREWSTSLSNRLVDIRYYDLVQMRTVLAHYIAEALNDVLNKALGEHEQNLLNAKKEAIAVSGTKQYMQAGHKVALAKAEYTKTNKALMAVRDLRREDRRTKRMKAMESFLCEQIGTEAYEAWSIAWKEANPTID